MEKINTNLRPGIPISLRTSLIYVLTGFSWIFFTDIFLEAVIRDTGDLTTIQIYKGSLFILITAVILFIVLTRYTRKIHQVEERFRKTVEEVKDYAIFQLDKEGRILNWNIGAERLTGYKSAEIVGENFSLFYPQKDVNDKLPEEHLKSISETGKFISEGIRRRKDGTYFYAYISISILKNMEGGIPWYLMIIHDISERKKNEETLFENREQIRALMQHIETVRDDERINISRKIHDELGQILTSLKMDLAFIAGKINLPGVSIQDQFSDMALKIDKSIDTLRKVSSDLRPDDIDILGLYAAIESEIAMLMEKSGLKIIFISNLADFQITNKKVSIGIYRIFQEAMTNILRHSGASMVQVKLVEQDNDFILEITDNGSGFDSAGITKKSLGLIGMKERAVILEGDLVIISSPGNGCKITLSMPMSKFDIIN